MTHSASERVELNVFSHGRDLDNCIYPPPDFGPFLDLEFSYHIGAGDENRMSSDSFEVQPIMCAGSSQSSVVELPEQGVFLLSPKWDLMS